MEQKLETVKNPYDAVPIMLSARHCGDQGVIQMADVSKTPEFGYFRDKIMEIYADDLKRMNSIPSGAIAEILSKDPFDLAPEQLDSIRRHLEFAFSVRQEMGTALPRT